MGPKFDARAWNQAAASQTPWGIQELARPMNAEDIMATINGTYAATEPGPVATRIEQYNPASYQQAVGLSGLPYTGPAPGTGGFTTGPGTGTPGAPRDLKTFPGTYAPFIENELITKYGSDWRGDLKKLYDDKNYYEYDRMLADVEKIIAETRFSPVD